MSYANINRKYVEETMEEVLLLNIHSTACNGLRRTGRRGKDGPKRCFVESRKAMEQSMANDHVQPRNCVHGHNHLMADDGYCLYR